MVINYTNIYKTNKYLSSYLIEHPPSLPPTHIHTHTHTHTQETTTYDIWNPGPVLGQAQNVAGLNQFMGSQHPLPLSGSLTAIHI